MGNNTLLAALFVSAIFFMSACATQTYDIPMSATMTAAPTSNNDPFLSEYSALLRNAGSYSFSGTLSIQKGNSTTGYSVTFCSADGEQAMSFSDFTGAYARRIWSQGERMTVNDQAGTVSFVADDGAFTYDIQELFTNSSSLKKTKAMISGISFDMYELINGEYISRHYFDSNGSLVQSKYYVGKNTIVMDYNSVQTGITNTEIFTIPDDYSRSRGISDEIVPVIEPAIELPSAYPFDTLPLCTGARITEAAIKKEENGIQITLVYDTYITISEADEWYTRLLRDGEDFNAFRLVSGGTGTIIMTGKADGWNVSSINIERASGESRTKIKLIIIQ